MKAAEEQLRRVEEAWAELTGANMSQGHHASLKYASLLFGAATVAIIATVLAIDANPWFLLWSAWPLLNTLRFASEYQLKTCVLSGVGGMCTYSAMTVPSPPVAATCAPSSLSRARQMPRRWSVRHTLRVERDFSRRRLGKQVSFAVPKRGLALNERKGLRLRSQIYMLYVVLTFFALANVVGLIWALVAPPVTCVGMVSAPEHGCATVDPVGLTASIVGALSAVAAARQLLVFVTTPLVMLPGERNAGGCVMENAGTNHREAMGIISKGGGTFLMAFELMVAIIPLQPYWYLLGLGPAILTAVTAAQRYFRM